MGSVEVVDRGSREIVVFLRDDVGTAEVDAMAAAVDEVDQLEELSSLSRVVVDCRAVTSLGDEGVQFLRRLQQRGERHGFTLSLSMLSQPAHHALEQAGWPGIPATWDASHHARERH
jgi:hypothetical protein